MIVTLVGGISGLALGLVSGAGALLTIPLLVYILHLSVYSAITLSLLLVIFTAMLGIWPRWCDIDFSTAFWTILGGILAAPVGANIGESTSESILLLSFGLLILFFSITLLRKGQTFFSSDLSQSRVKVGLTSNDWPFIFLAGVIGGFMSGMYGLGGGLVLIPLYLHAIGLNKRQAVATSLLSIIPIAAVAVIIHWGKHPMGMGLIGALLTGSFLGVVLGAQCLRLRIDQVASKIITLVMFGLSIYLLIDNI